MTAGKKSLGSNAMGCIYDALKVYNKSHKLLYYLRMQSHDDSCINVYIELLQEAT